MPHLMLEYSANVAPPDDLDTLFGELHRLVHEVGGVRTGNIKSRARRCDDFYIGDGDARGAFVHMEVWLLDHRALDRQRAVGAALLEHLKTVFDAHRDDIDLQITVQVRDVHRAAYFKHPEGTLTPVTGADSG